jgi:cytidine deaminase
VESFGFSPASSQKRNLHATGDFPSPKKASWMTRRAFLSTGIAGSGATIIAAQSIDQHVSAADPLEGIGLEARRLLLTTIRENTFRGRIPAAVVSEILRLEKRTADDLMLRLVPLAKTFSRPPLSHFVVGAVIRGISGSFYLGANIEVPGRPLGLSVHAEQAAVANAYVSGESAIAAIAVSEAPCGHCRQFLYEVSPDGQLRILMPRTAPTSLSALLPMAFGPSDMGLKQGAFPIGRHAMSLARPATDALILAALDAAQRSYSPYTLSPSGVAIATRDSRIFPGCYIENAAFNPSLPPLEAALAGLFAGGKAADDVVRAVLVESASSRISQETITREALSSLAPHATVEVLKARI